MRYPLLISFDDPTQTKADAIGMLFDSTTKHISETHGNYFALALHWKGKYAGLVTFVAPSSPCLFEPARDLPVELYRKIMAIIEETDDTSL